jgi:hypothetical protein
LVVTLLSYVVTALLIQLVKAIAHPHIHHHHIIVRVHRLVHPVAQIRLLPPGRSRPLISILISCDLHHVILRDYKLVDLIVLILYVVDVLILPLFLP